MILPTKGMFQSFVTFYGTNIKKSTLANNLKYYSFVLATISIKNILYYKLLQLL